MQFAARCLLAAWLVVAPFGASWADAGGPASALAAPIDELVPFASDEGMNRLARSTAKVDFPALANQFEAQYNAAFCGPTSAAIVLNAMRSRSTGLPVDRTRLRADDTKYIPGRFDPIVPRYTPDSVIGKGRKTRAQVLGEPVMRNGEAAPDFGYQIRQLDEVLQAHGLATRLTIVDSSTPDEDVRRDLVANLERRGDYAIVNYRREAVGQKGGGHISPLGAYDASSDSFLVLDVNPASAGWVWMTARTLINGMRTFDTVENRGYILIESR